ncbi:hypothetical protein [Microbacterium hydrocarbonoxydans]|uniref:hypothetical protein n=1 Tax=Microbacterium hydrocarbonoxydans TaxID=273678 RepID=UPI00203E6FB4|nr:hypothetical protein [Microbacterium hydrocarbonoxydans]MCM3778991.1 hypothetical protein [Microbacterium hydrocarbonoxydans]
MASLITVNDGTTGSISPALVLGYQTARESQNIVHDLIGGGIAVTLIAPRPRSGRLELFFLTEADGFGALTKHGLETTFTLSDTDRPSVGMTYVTDGSLDLALDDQGRSRWVLSVGYQEVQP